jgi:hypothetical protein
VGRARGRRRLG